MFRIENENIHLSYHFCPDTDTRILDLYRDSEHVARIVSGYIIKMEGEADGVETYSTNLEKSTGQWTLTIVRLYNFNGIIRIV
ncbi:MAG: hypothetical protein GXO26_08185 [Crenarchaeota archaeon]|nr:hypothetical protein [Thermoproteota archaeon]